MDINLQIFVGGEKNVLRMKGVPENLADPIVREFFQSIGQEESEKIEKKIDIPKVLDIKIPDSPNFDPIKGISEVGENFKKELSRIGEIITSRNRKLPVLGQETRSSFPISESAVVKTEEEPEHWKTGIKIEEDGTKRYRCYYRCECGAKGKRYIFIDADTVDCRDCGEPMFVELATGSVDTEGIPERDSFGNFFVAGERSE